jgi:hypothetical protein
MLLSKEVEVNLNSSTISYYENLGYEIPRVYDNKRNRYTVKVGTKIIVKAEDVMKGSTSVYFDVRCDYCGKEHKKKVSKYYLHKNEYNSKDACDSCKSKKSDETMMIKYGLTHNTQLDSVKQNVSKALRIDIKIVIDLFDKKGLDIVDIDNFKYINESQHVAFICRKHKEKGIQYTNYYNLNQNSGNACGCKFCKYDKISRNNCHLWNGGITDITRYLRGKIYYWKSNTLKKYNFKCDITGVSDNIIIHHLYGFDQILQETMDSLQLPIYEKINKYTEYELKQIENKCLELHYKYGLGVCLCTDEHKKFHSIYGYGKNTPNQYYEFKEMRLKELNKDLKVAN